jgi:hypothetical protein
MWAALTTLREDLKMQIIDRTDDELALTVKFSRQQIAEILAFLHKTLLGPDMPPSHSPQSSHDQEPESQTCGDRRER